MCTRLCVCFRRFPEESAEAIAFLEETFNDALLLKAELREPCLQWRHLGGAAQSLAAAHLERGEFEDAEKWLKIAIAETKEFLKRPNRDPGELYDLAGCLSVGRRLAAAQGDQERAEKYAEQWLAHVTDAANKHPDYYVFRDALDRADELMGKRK